MIRLVAGLFLLIGGVAQAQIPPEIEARLPPPYFRVYVVAVCAAAEEVSEDCMAEGLRHGAYALSEMYLRAYRGQLVWNSLRLRFPYGWAQASQTRFLQDLEKRAIALATDQIGRDIAARMLPEQAAVFASRIERWRTDALMEAATGDNWSHGWSEYRHDFAPVHVTRQLTRAELRS